MATSQARAPVPEDGAQTALLISTEEEDRQTLEALFQQQGWNLYAVQSLDLARAMLGQDDTPSIVITERDLPAGNWKDVLEFARGLAEPPLLIVITRLADESLWSEALNLGAYDVLAKPLVPAEVVRVLTSAWIQQLTRKVHLTQNAYHEAAAEYAKVRTQYGEMLDHPDTTSAVFQAASKEGRAAQKYRAAVQAYRKSLGSTGPPTDAAS
jgi:DNA-binding response OmpR family regulator